MLRDDTGEKMCHFLAPQPTLTCCCLGLPAALALPPLESVSSKTVETMRSLLPLPAACCCKRLGDSLFALFGTMPALKEELVLAGCLIESCTCPDCW